jgi:hypothetical protein
LPYQILQKTNPAALRSSVTTTIQDGRNPARTNTKTVGQSFGQTAWSLTEPCPKPTLMMLDEPLRKPTCSSLGELRHEETRKSPETRSLTQTSRNQSVSIQRLKTETPNVRMTEGTMLHQGLCSLAPTSKSRYAPIQRRRVQSLTGLKNVSKALILGGRSPRPTSLIQIVSCQRAIPGSPFEHNSSETTLIQGRSCQRLTR